MLKNRLQLFPLLLLQFMGHNALYKCTAFISLSPTLCFSVFLLSPRVWINLHIQGHLLNVCEHVWLYALQANDNYFISETFSAKSLAQKAIDGMLVSYINHTTSYKWRGFNPRLRMLVCFYILFHLRSIKRMGILCYCYVNYWNFLLSNCDSWCIDLIFCDIII